jgi:heat shock protein HslJ
MQEFLRLRLHAAALGASILAVAIVTGDAAEMPFGKWLAEDIRGGGVLDRPRSVLEIRRDGAVGGSGGCNRLLGRARIDGETIVFDPVASTRMACTPVVMDQELKFHAALKSARRFAVEPEQRKLVLYDADGRIVMRLARR